MGQWLHLEVLQSPHNRGSIADFSITWKLCLQKDWHADFSMFNNITQLSSIGMKTQHARLQHTTKYEQQLYKEWFSPIYTIDDCINRIPIADQSRCSVLQSRMSRYEGRFINLRLAFAIGSHMLSWSNHAKKNYLNLNHDQPVHANWEYQDTTTPLRSVGPSKIEGVLTNGGCLMVIYRGTIRKKTPTKTDPSMMYLMISPNFPAPTP